MEWYIKVLKQYFDFKGRARRKEYWMFMLFNIIFIIVLMVISEFIDGLFNTRGIGSIFLGFYYLGMIIPSLAVVVRRLHDQNKSGWYYFICFIPVIGGLWLFVLLVTEGDRKSNKYGPDPKNPNTELDDIGVAEA